VSTYRDELAEIEDREDALDRLDPSRLPWRDPLDHLPLHRANELTDEDLA
jgi:hypothetical protein